MRTLVLAAHGSAHPGYTAVFDWIADRIVGNRPDMDVVVGYLDHCEPRLTELGTDGAVVVPMLLATGYHLETDIPAAAPNATVADPIGPDPRLTAVVADRLAEAGWTPGTPVVLAAAGSSDERGVVDVRAAAVQLAELLDVEVTAAFAGGGQPSLSEVDAKAVATYLLAPGHFADTIAGCGASVISAPIGADPRVADVAISRYDDAVLSP
ncbi:MAG TPA: CbiX/SirB N-terminal domain-containing protein [Mycobacteriales bacterium]|nr:CbiX/SirB N-terminal domain-containing protein [Mycobacteriales bacterium]